MPMTMWDDIVGYTCLYCGKWATHFYGNVPICCVCHNGERVEYEGNDYMAQQAIIANTKFQKGLPVSLEAEADIIEREILTISLEDTDTLPEEFDKDFVPLVLDFDDSQWGSKVEWTGDEEWEIIDNDT